MICISIKQPFAFLILNNKKPIENRTWRLPEKYKGKRVLIHASAKWDDRHRDMSSLFTKDQWNALDEKMQRIMAGGVLPTSAIIGSVVISDCVINHLSVWAEETPLKDAGFAPSDGWLLVVPDLTKVTYNWVLSEPILFDQPILDVKGKLNFWESDIEICHICGKPITKEYLCNYCDEYYCDDCSAKYDQFSQIDCNCCKKCAEKKHE